jgi:hypothetical protein
MKAEGIFSNLFYEIRNMLIPDKDATRKEKEGQTSPDRT